MYECVLLVSDNKQTPVRHRCEAKMFIVVVHSQVPNPWGSWPPSSPRRQAVFNQSLATRHVYSFFNSATMLDPPV